MAEKKNGVVSKVINHLIPPQNKLAAPMLVVRIASGLSGAYFSGSGMEARMNVLQNPVFYCVMSGVVSLILQYGYEAVRRR